MVLFSEYSGLSEPLALAAGVGVGLFFFGGLWWTVRNLPASRNPALLIFASAVGRMLVACAGFLAATAGRPLSSILWIAGFLAMRIVLSRTLGAQPATREEKA
ncbi:ATP synthase subunit I [Oceanidesulfovibrio indonesiensis]|uniref:ATP synthase subunit I n=2 Tax=Oceanidesulfovibrio indonesiensis TaxID=54767 RepID=A0A7M3MB85_9BACT|nr:ATP synthase subunit I [Oceanidesulfovibrio indonesiensis]